MTSPYLLKPKRTLAQARRDIERQRRPAHLDRDGQPDIGHHDWHASDQAMLKREVQFVERLPDSRVNRDWIRLARKMLERGARK